LRALPENAAEQTSNTLSEPRPHEQKHKGENNVEEFVEQVIYRLFTALFGDARVANSAR